jgi:hypothetical protein
MKKDDDESRKAGGGDKQNTSVQIDYSKYQPFIEEIVFITN